MGGVLLYLAPVERRAAAVWTLLYGTVVLPTGAVGEHTVLAVIVVHGYPEVRSERPYQRMARLHLGTSKISGRVFRRWVGLNVFMRLISFIW